MKYIATVLFICAVLHTFAVKIFLKLAHRFREGSIGENLFHFLGEVEVVFGVWASIFIGIWTFRFGTDSAAHYLDSINYTEAAFVFVIMCMAATKPLLVFAEKLISQIAKFFPVHHQLALYWSVLIFGPLLGSLITEPAAMTVSALLVRDHFFRKQTSQSFRYATLGLLFVNISIGGTLSHFAAPPILMVAGHWKWDFAFVFSQFGIKAACAVVLGTILTGLYFRKELAAMEASSQATADHLQIPFWVTGIHLFFIFMTVLTAHYVSFFIPLFLFFLGWCAVSKEYQESLRLRESLLVGFFLGGLVTLGKLQDWWLAPLLSQLGSLELFWGATALTAITDNAALTYLGTLVSNLPASAKYALVAGAVTGGGLTVIANAPNPIGYGLLKEAFGEDGISASGLFLGALPYTLLAAGFFLAFA